MVLGRSRAALPPSDLRAYQQGLELPHVSLRYGEELLLVFSSAEADQHSSVCTHSRRAARERILRWRAGLDALRLPRGYPAGLARPRLRQDGARFGGLGGRLSFRGFLGRELRFMTLKSASIAPLGASRRPASSSRAVRGLPAPDSYGILRASENWQRLKGGERTGSALPVASAAWL